MSGAVRRRSEINTEEPEVELLASSVSLEHQVRRIDELERANEDANKRLAFLNSDLNRKDKEITDLKRKLEEKPKEITQTKTNIPKEISDAIIEKLATKTSEAVVKKIGEQAKKNIDMVPAARWVNIRFIAEEAMWVDPNSTMQHVLKCWKEHLKRNLSIETGELDDFITVSLTVPEIKCAARSRKSVKSTPILIDADQ